MYHFAFVVLQFSVFVYNSQLFRVSTPAADPHRSQYDLVLRPSLRRTIWDKWWSRPPAICTNECPGNGGAVRGTRSRGWVRKATGACIARPPPLRGHPRCRGGGSHPPLSHVFATPSSRQTSLVAARLLFSPLRIPAFFFYCATPPSAPSRVALPQILYCGLQWGGASVRARMRLEVCSGTRVVLRMCASATFPLLPPTATRTCAWGHEWLSNYRWCMHYIGPTVLSSCSPHRISSSFVV